MLSQIAAVATEVVLVCEVLFGAVLLLLWAALEVIGYGGLLFSIVRNQRWFIVVSAPSKPPRDIRWGITVRAAGLRLTRSKFLIPNS
jgi:hypothetical protein